VTGGVTIRDCEFYANLTTLTGGAIDAYDAVLTVESCIFDYNATNGSTEQRGGAIHLRGFNDGTVIRNCTFNENQADQGGAVYWKGSCDFEDCIFTDNQAERGGALYGTSITASQVHTSTFDGCTASDNGGAIYAAGTGLDLRYCLFEECTSGANGGAVYLGGGSATEIRYNTFDSCSANKGGGIGVAGMLTDLYRNTFYGCSAATSGAALYFQQTNTQVVQNIFAASTNVEAVFGEFTATPDFTANLVHGNAAGDYEGIDPTGTNGNLADDPEFCDEGEDDFRIASTSPAAPGNGPSESDDTGIGSGGVGCGVTAVVQTTWGALKTRFGK
jgi:predicted outer membrane repeat protein